MAGASPTLLSALIEKSLLRRGVTGRYDMHEVVRQYASEKLAESAAARSVRKSHLEFFLQAASEAELHLLQHGASDLAGSVWRLSTTTFAQRWSGRFSMRIRKKRVCG